MMEKEEVEPAEAVKLSVTALNSLMGSPGSSRAEAQVQVLIHTEATAVAASNSSRTDVVVTNDVRVICKKIPFRCQFHQHFMCAFFCKKCFV